MPFPTHTSRTSSPSPSIKKSPANESKEQQDKEEKDSSTTAMDNNPSPPSITIRRAKLKDSQTLGTILAAGFIDDDVFGEYLFPHRREYPDDYRLQFARMMRSHMYKRGHRVRVAVDSSSSRVIGVASWERQGRKKTSKSTTATKEKRSNNDHNNNSVCLLFKHVAIRSLDAISSIIHPDRSVSVENKRNFDAEVPNYKHYWSGSRSETWYLSFLAVDAEYRGCGAGRALVEEGIRWGETDGVCVSLISTECGDGFYQRLGFVDVGSATQGALKGLRGGSIKFYERHLEKSEKEEEDEEKQS